MKLEKNTITVGLEKPVKLLHVTDTHLALCDGRDNERKQALAARRTHMAKASDHLSEQLSYAGANCDLTVHTGDLIDFVSHANVEKAREILKNERVFFIAGNHEYSQYVGEAWEDNAYRMNSYMEIERMGGFGAPMLWNTRVVGGVNIVGVDNSYYLFEDWHLERLKAEAKKGLPIILALHDPLFEESLFQYHFKLHPHEPCAYLTGCDEEHLARYNEFRAVQQRPDGPTKRMIEYIKSEPLIKAILTGHLHFSYESFVTPTLPQFVTGGGYEGAARELTVL